MHSLIIYKPHHKRKQLLPMTIVTTPNFCLQSRIRYVNNRRLLFTSKYLLQYRFYRSFHFPLTLLSQHFLLEFIMAVSICHITNISHHCCHIQIQSCDFRMLFNALRHFWHRCWLAVIG